MKSNCKSLFLMSLAIIAFDSCKEKDDPCILTVTISAPGNIPTANASGGMEPYSYLWSTGDVTRQITTGTLLGDFSVTVTDANNCTATGAGNVSCGNLVNISHEGNNYRVIGIGNRCWLTENLSATAAIPQVVDSIAWAALSTPGWCYYKNNSSNSDPYGILYNWYALSDTNLCPDGWHVATDTDWQDLINALGGYAVAGGPLKSTTNWAGSNTGATNTTGFSAVGGSFRVYNGGWDDIPHQTGQYWTSTVKDSANAYSWVFHSNIVNVTQLPVLKNWGLSCRCVKD